MVTIYDKESNFMVKLNMKYSSTRERCLKIGKIYIRTIYIVEGNYDKESNFTVKLSMRARLCSEYYISLQCLHVLVPDCTSHGKIYIRTI